MAGNRSKNNKSSAASPTKDISEENTLRIFSDLLNRDEFFDKICNKIAEKIESRITDLLSNYMVKISAQEEIIQEQKSKIIMLESQMEIVQQASLCNNIRIYGLKETSNEDTRATVCRVINDSLCLPRISSESMNKCFRVGKRSDKTRPIFVEFHTRQDRNMVYSNKRLLKGSKITIKEDLHINKRTLMKEVTEMYGYRNVWSSDGLIFVKVNNRISKFNSLLEWRNHQANQLTKIE